jgi:hypothetical protein
MVVTASSGRVVEVFRHSSCAGKLCRPRRRPGKLWRGTAVRGRFSAPAEARVMPAQSLLTEGRDSSEGSHPNAIPGKPGSLRNSHPRIESMGMWGSRPIAAVMLLIVHQPYPQLQHRLRFFRASFFLVPDIQHPYPLDKYAMPSSMRIMAGIPCPRTSLIPDALVS